MCRRRRMWRRRRIIADDAATRDSQSDDAQQMQRRRVLKRLWRRRSCRVASAADTLRLAIQDAVVGAEPGGPNCARRDGGVLAAGAGAVADWQRRCTGTVSGSRDAGAARQPVTVRFGRAGRAGAHVGARGAGIERLMAAKRDGSLTATSASERLGTARHETCETHWRERRSARSADLRIPRFVRSPTTAGKLTPGAIFFALARRKTGRRRICERRAGARSGCRCQRRSAPGGYCRQISHGSNCCRERSGAALARAAANFYGHPADALKLVGVTGTNGKTTTAFLVDSILRAAGIHDGTRRHDGLPHAEGQPRGA